MNKESHNLLMVFIKNPVLGKVKTRLAKTIGDEKALKVYRKLLEHTNQITKQVEANKAIFYSDFIDNDDFWLKEEFIKYTQEGELLGDKMSNAFAKAFNLGYKRVVVIGSDCFELNEEIISNAFKVLENNEAVIGPAKDGGYYLLGMQKHYKPLFENKTWSTENVLRDTLLDLATLNLTFKLLPTLSDIDEEKDLINYPNIIEE